MKLLLTNDDGIDAEGLQALLTAARHLGDPYVIAPAGPAIRLQPHGDDPSRRQNRTARRAPLCRPRDAGPIACAWDCIACCPMRAGFSQGSITAATWGPTFIIPARSPRSAKACCTVGPASPSRITGTRGLEFDWPRAARLVQPILQDLLTRPPEAGAFWNINLPYVTERDPDPEIAYCPLDPTPLPLSYRHAEDEFHSTTATISRAGGPKVCDVDVCFGGRIAVTKIRLL